MNEFSAIDGTIKKITSTPRKISVEFLDWKEQLWMLTFENVVSFLSSSAEGAEISEITINTLETLKTTTTNEPTINLQTYTFLCAWHQIPALTVIASGFHQTKITPDRDTPSNAPILRQ
ncbi:MULTISPECIES: hypothetical protein [unclassified Pseudomonas]|uniref:hypothetical protein n=1 Tax=unclassified Pseudomonas TaxID=196821 RepID=UPI00111C26DA|nr:MULTISPECIES: hypothetical protein [unclassified Pseudomonas]